MQKLIWSDPYEAKAIINDHLAKGWKIVPGSIYLVSVEESIDTRYATEGTYNKATSSRFVSYLFAVVEKE